MADLALLVLASQALSDLIAKKDVPVTIPQKFATWQQLVETRGLVVSVDQSEFEAYREREATLRALRG